MCTAVVRLAVREFGICEHITITPLHHSMVTQKKNRSKKARLSFGRVHVRVWERDYLLPQTQPLVRLPLLHAYMTVLTAVAGALGRKGREFQDCIHTRHHCCPIYMYTSLLLVFRAVYCVYNYICIHHCCPIYYTCVLT